ncbi:MAG: hypothetical protein NUV56_03205 [Candidatus Uhrbacteria bacterium]|nr:hypothetical protein [Candidatus Uhrbacteria bacterium]
MFIPRPGMWVDIDPTGICDLIEMVDRQGTAIIMTTRRRKVVAFLSFGKVVGISVKRIDQRCDAYDLMQITIGFGPTTLHTYEVNPT